jgi:hypothetical protein
MASCFLVTITWPATPTAFFTPHQINSLYSTSSLSYFYLLSCLHHYSSIPFISSQLFSPFFPSPPSKNKTNKLHGLSPRANYTDQATAACRRSDCQLLRIEGATCCQRDGSPRPYSRFSRQEPLLFYQVAPQLYSPSPSPSSYLLRFLIRFRTISFIQIIVIPVFVFC